MATFILFLDLIIFLSSGVIRKPSIDPKIHDGDGGREEKNFSASPTIIKDGGEVQQREDGDLVRDPVEILNDADGVPQNLQQM